MATGTSPTILPFSPVAAVERLGVIMRPAAGEPTEVEGVLNPAIARSWDGEVYLFARAVGEGNFSRIRMARVLFDGAGRPYDVERLGFALEPEAPYELRGPGQGGCEDPRITYLPALRKYVMAYTGYGPAGARVALAVSSDLFTWERLGLVEFGVQDGTDFDDFSNKDAFFFPEPVIAPDGVLSFALMHRPMTGADHEWKTESPLQWLPPSIWVSYVPVAAVMKDERALTQLRQHRLVMKPEYGWEHVKLGGGTPPLLLGNTWLTFHHGIRTVTNPAGPRKLEYAAGITLLDRCDPTRVLWRSGQSILAPETAEELAGVVNNVVFPTGVDVVGPDKVDVYYGMADTRIGVARVWLREAALVLDDTAVA